MKKSFIAFAAIAALVSCTDLKEEFQPVFTTEYEQPAPYKTSSLSANTTIAELAAMYKSEQPFEVKKNIVVSGIVSTTDQPGNFYKSFYIQDETGGIEIKIGKNSLYNDYRPGQRVFVKCKGLTVGMYGFKTGNYGGAGMVQIGYSDPSGSYETSYLESALLIDTHIFRGEYEGEVTPYVITESQLPTKSQTQKSNKYVGSLVTLKGLKYAKENFCLLYINANKDKTSYTNRIFLSDTNGVDGGDKTHGITTWAMSESKMKEYMMSGIWDSCQVGSGNNYLKDESGHIITLGDLRGDGTYPTVDKAAYSISQYFTMGKTEIQLRTSGYCKFCDAEIPQEVLDGKATVDITGVLTMYQGSVQLVVNSLDDIVINK